MSKETLPDTKLKKEIIIVVRNHYRKNYTGYDTYIDETNILEHIGDMCRDIEEMSFRMNAIKSLIEK